MKILFRPKNAGFLQKIADIIKIKMVLLLKGILPETKYVVYLRAKFEFSIVILTIFKQGEGASKITQKRAPKKKTQITVKCS